MTANADFRSLTDAERACFDWVRRAPIRKIADALDAAEPGGSRFVGGCVRDSLLGAEPKDVDIATTLTPAEVIRALKAAGLTAAPTGLDHGTVTGVADHVGVEITTLRADVSTDGRRATVAFTKDWRVDAGRRDFRLNAIYLTLDGRLFDPVGGVEDARSSRVRFIGAAADRIREDYLRILRFFRFSARFAGGFDAEGLAACAALADGMDILSAERIGAEFCRILAHANAALAIDAMAATGVLARVWTAPADRRTLRRLKELDPYAPAPLGLAALFGGSAPGDSEQGMLDRALRLSNADGARRRRALEAAAAIPGLDFRSARRHLYRMGVEAFDDGLKLAEARGAGADFAYLRGALREAPPAFPVSGRHVVALGIPPGPLVSAVVEEVEARWIAEDFPSAARVQVLLEEAVAAHRPRS